MDEHKDEYENSRFSVILAPNFANALIENHITPTVVAEIEYDLDVYFDFNPSTFGGVILHPFGTGPENPYFRPRPGSEDWNPIVQSVARIGVQSLYWRNLYTSLMAETLDLEDMISMEVIPLYPTASGGIEIIIETFSGFLESVASKCGHTAPQHPGYIKTVNYGDDRDFYRSNKHRIFPMYIESQENNLTYVELNTLGLQEGLVQDTWDSWYNLWNIHGGIYHDCVRSVIKNRKVAQTVVTQLQSYSEKFDTGLDIVHALSFPKIDWVVIDLVLKAVKDEFCVLYATGESEVLVDAAKTHVENLAQMYDIAKRHCSDVYHY